VPSKGDIVWLNFDPEQGNEIKKTRPALVISPHKYNIKTNLALFMPITSQIKGYPFEIEIEEKEIKGAILCDQLRSFDWVVRKAKKITSLNTETMELVISKFKLLID
jgi:mRNA interferase MazF